MKWNSIILMACTAQAIFFLLQKTNVLPLYSINGAGSFDNIAGFASCLVLGLPIGEKQLKNGAPLQKWTVITSKIICIIAIVWAQSKAGILCVILWLFLLYCPRNKQKRLFMLFPLLIVGLLFYKSDSSKGRWFILQRSYEMITEHPLLGWGQGGFKAHYMDWQADYFQQNPASSFAILASNIHHPLNEWIAITIDFGVVGLIVVTIIFLCTLNYAERHPSDLSQMGKHIIILLALFSFFSYPFQYPFTWIMMVWGALAIYHVPIYKHIKICSVMIITLVLLGGFHLYSQWRDETMLEKLYEKTNLGLYDKAMPKYLELYPQHKRDCQFLFYYASNLHLKGQEQLALQKAMLCKSYLADYELSLLFGDIYHGMRCKDSALFYYKRAHYMCPSRISPLYEMFNVYRDYEDKVGSTRLKSIILHKKNKIESKETNRIIQEVANDCE